MAAKEISIRWASGPGDVRGAVAVREQVFCLEQGVARAEELDGRDEEALHLIALAPDGSDVIATLRLLFEGSEVKVGRVAVRRAWRRQGIASRMLAAALERARECGSLKARLASQLDAVGLYEQAGFTVESEPFDDAGIAHVWMGRRLTAVEG